MYTGAEDLRYGTAPLTERTKANTNTQNQVQQKYKYTNTNPTNANTSNDYLTPTPFWIRLELWSGSKTETPSRTIALEQATSLHYFC